LKSITFLPLGGSAQKRRDQEASIWWIETDSRRHLSISIHQEQERLSPSTERDPFEVPRPKRKRDALSGVLRQRGARRLLTALFAAFGLLIGAAALAPWLYSSTAALSVVSDQLQKATGLYVALQGTPRLALTPRPHIVVDRIAFADHNGSLLVEADQLVGVLKLLPLLAGRLDVSSLALVRPRMRVDLDGKPIDAPGAAARAAAAAPGSPQAQKADDFRLGALNILDGALRLKRGGVTYLAEKIAATLEWSKIGEPALLTGAFDWRGERLQTVLWVARPGALLRGDPSVATARLDGDGLRLEAQGLAQGLAQTGANARFAGNVAGSIASVREALGLLDISAPLPGPFGDAQFSAQAVLSAREAAFKELHVTIDGNVFTGELAARDEDGRAVVSAALESDFVALKPMFSDAPALVGADGQWSREALEPPDLSGADVDLRLAAKHARLGRLTIDNANFAATLRGDVLDLSLLDAQAYRGRLKARASFKPAGGALTVRASAQTQGVDARALLWDAFGKQAVGGALDSTLSLDAAGATVADMMRALNGRATLGLSEGEIAGVDFERALRRLEKRPLSSAQDIRTGSSTLDKAHATLLVENGVASVEDGSAQGPGFALSFKGTANLAERSLSLKAVAREADAAGAPRDKGLQIAFDLVGGWDDLNIAPDPQSFIRRSGAAAPLLPEPPAAAGGAR
jgi:AsmA protein